MMNKTRGRGRPSGGSDARGQILEVAERRFLQRGYDGVTVRSIASEAGVDAALISYHFGSKAGLFGAAMRLPTNPAQVLTAAIGGPINTLPERLMRAVLDVWDDPDRGGPLRAFATAAVHDAEVGRLFRQMAEREIIGRLADRIGGADAERRAAVAVSQISGMIFLRYILRFEPLASMSADELTARMVPALRAALVGPRPIGNRTA